MAGGQLSLGTAGATPTVVNPVSSSASAWTLYAAAPVLLGAFTQQPDGTWQPSLVSGADVSTGPFTVTYHIDPAAVWSDGTAVTAADFIFTWQTMTNPSNASALTVPPGYALITSMNAIDDSTVEATFSSVYPNWKSLFSPVLPEHILTGQDISTVWNGAIDDPGTDDPIGDGPYLLSGFDPGGLISLTPNPNWWGAQAPWLTAIHIAFYNGDQAAEVSDLKAGVLNGIYDDSPPAAPTPQTALASLVSAKGIATQSQARQFYEQLYFNVDQTDAWVRQAIAYAIDRGTIEKALWGAISPGLPATQSDLFAPGQQGYAADFGSYTYSTKQVASLMSAHGCTLGGDKIWVCAGQRMSFDLYTTQGNAHRTLETTYMAAEAKAAGIELVPTPIPAPQLFGAVGTGDFQVALFAQTGLTDPGDWTTFYECANAANLTRYCNSSVDDDTAAAAGELDETTRLADFAQADAQLASDVPVLPLWNMPDFLAYSTAVGGMVDNPFAGPLWNAAGIWQTATSSATPTITSFTPDTGPDGTHVFISGSGFTGTKSVTIGGTKAAFTVSSDSVLQATVAAGTLSGPIVVTNAAGNITSSSSFTVAPKLTSFTPAKGAAATLVTLTGSGFTGATDVTFNGTPAQSFTVVSDSKITATVADGSTSGQIAVVGPGGTATSSASFGLPCTVSSLGPDSGPSGTSVTIGGSGFTGATSVTFGGVHAQGFVVNSDSQITAVVAANTKTGKVTVTGPGGSGTSPGVFTVTATVGSFTPAKAKIGATVNITGTGFTGTTAVQFGGTDAQSFLVKSNTLITAVVAPGTTSGQITVTTPGGQATSASSFVVAPTVGSFLPIAGVAGGPVTIHGSGFTGATAVKFGTKAAQSFTVDSDTQITATDDWGTTAGKITVTGPGGSATSATSFGVTLSVVSFTPTKGAVGSTVAITGVGFTGATDVLFNGNSAQSFVVQSATKITAVVAAGTTAGVITVDAPAGVSSSGASFAPTTFVNSLVPAQVVAGATVTIHGGGFSGATAVTVNGKNVQTFNVDSDTQITATVAAGTTSGKVAVTTPGGKATSADTLSVLSITSFTPAQGPYATTVTVNGSGFTAATDVQFNGADAQSFTVTSDTKLTAVIAPGATSGVISVSTAVGTVSSAGSFTMTVGIIDLAVCPTSDTTDNGGVLLCNDDFSGAAFSPGDDLTCSVGVLNATGHTMGMSIVQGTTVKTGWGPGTIGGDSWIGYVEFVFDPQIANGSYQCNVQIDGATKAVKKFTVSQ